MSLPLCVACSHPPILINNYLLTDFNLMFSDEFTPFVAQTGENKAVARVAKKLQKHRGNAKWTKHQLTSGTILEDIGIIRNHQNH